MSLVWSLLAAWNGYNAINNWPSGWSIMSGGLCVFCLFQAFGHAKRDL